MATEQAYVLRCLDGDMEPCAVVYATTEVGAKRTWRAIQCADGPDGIEAERRPEFDVYAPNGPTTRDLFARHGWWFECVDCHNEQVSHEDDPDAVVVGRDSVRCGECVASAGNG